MMITNRISTASRRPLWWLLSRHTRRQHQATPNVGIVVRGLASSTAAAAPPPQHQLNINNALKKKTEGDSFGNLVEQPVTVLQGIGPKHAEELNRLGLDTIQKLSEYKFYHLAKSILVLSQVEDENGRSSGDSTEEQGSSSCMNLNKGLIKKYEHCALKEIAQQPVHVLQGISPEAGETFRSLGVKTVEDLANFKYCQWAEAIVNASKFEEK